MATLILQPTSKNNGESVTEELEITELKVDPRFKDRDNRKVNRKELTTLIEKKLKEKTTSYWIEALNKRGVPTGDILELETALSTAQAKHRNIIQTINEDGIGELKLFNLTAKFEKTPGKVENPPPRLSADSEEILEQVGYSRKDISQFREQGIV